MFSPPPSVPISNLTEGDAIPMPTLPVFSIEIPSAGVAPVGEIYAPELITPNKNGTLLPSIILN